MKSLPSECYWCGLSFKNYKYISYSIVSSFSYSGGIRGYTGKAVCQDCGSRLTKSGNFIFVSPVDIVDKKDISL